MPSLLQGYAKEHWFSDYQTTVSPERETPFYSTTFLSNRYKLPIFRTNIKSRENRPVYFFSLREGNWHKYE